MRDDEQTPRYRTMHSEEGDVLYAEYVYRGITYQQCEITVDQELQIGELLCELNIDSLRSLSDVINVRLGMFISAALKNRVAPRLLALVLTRPDGKQVTEEDFRKGLAREFNPFFKEVATDFFSLNSSVVEPITMLARKVLEPLRAVEGLFAQLKQSMSSQAATSRGGRASGVSTGATR